jgi:hypothetical protein
MLQRTHIPEAPWWVIRGDEKKRARLNCIQHLLGQIPFQELPSTPIQLPPRQRNAEYVRHPVPGEMYVPEVY